MLELFYARVEFPFQLNVSENWKETSRYALWIWDPGLLLPDTTYY